MLNRLSEHKLLRARQGLTDLLNGGNNGNGSGNGNGNGNGNSAAASAASSTGQAASSQPPGQSSTSPPTTSHQIEHILLFDYRGVHQDVARCSSGRWHDEFLPLCHRTSATFAEGSTVSASDTPTVSGAVNTGAVVGGIAGGLIALAALGFIVCFFMMYERGHTVAPSVTSMTGPGVAGQGAVYYNQPQAQGPQDFRNQYSDHPYATSPPPRNQPLPQPLQERPQYTFGQAPDNNYHPNVMSDDGHGNYEGHGAYSSEPQMQMAYNAEDYSGYHAYSPDMAPGYAGGQAGYAGAHARTKSSNTVADDAYGGI
ncbi:hypothetical protein BDZ89DRAFT_1160862 [Hymenopellis radicata]|nr:hypothetical protein BDZ89DRAFT_1160862 [Hymenopellis radicata]